jgi:energy-coupling factor transport system ATP-binding protein
MGITGDQLEYRIKNSLEMVNMDYSYYKDRTPFSLSGGEMRRVAIASILAMDPEIIILDEPTASLDPYNCSKILSVIKNLYEKYNRTIIIVSHSMEIIAELTNRIIVMEKGRVIMDDKPKSIFSDSAARLEESGLSLPPITSVMNKLKKYKKTVSSAILSIDEATDEICKMIKKNKNEFF